MSVTHLMSTTAEAGAQRYGLLIDGWKILFSRALDSHDFGTQKQMTKVVADAYTMGSMFLVGEAIDITDALEDIAEQALTATNVELNITDAEEFSDALSAHVVDFDAHLTSELALQIERDIALLKKTLRDTYLSVSIAGRAQRLPLRTALMQHRIAGVTDVQFSFQDRRNAKWPAKRFIRSTWRHNLLALYNDTVLMTLADHGVDTAQIRHDDTTSAMHGLEISIASNTDLPTYADIRNEAFHPNANAIVARQV